MLLVVLAVLGFLISLYGFSIEQRLKTNPDYKPMCDISDRASCTKPIKSPLGKLFGISNTIVGMLFYPSIALLALVGWNGFVFIGSFGAFIVSLYLAYILFFQIRALCMICIATYFINAVLLVVSAITVFK